MKSLRFTGAYKKTCLHNISSDKKKSHTVVSFYEDIDYFINLFLMNEMSFHWNENI